MPDTTTVGVPDGGDWAATVTGPTSAERRRLAVAVGFGEVDIVNARAQAGRPTVPPAVADSVAATVGLRVGGGIRRDQPLELPGGAARLKLGERRPRGKDIGICVGHGYRFPAASAEDGETSSATYVGDADRAVTEGKYRDVRRR